MHKPPVNGNFCFHLVEFNDFLEFRSSPVRFYVDLFKCKTRKHALIKGLLSYYKYFGKKIKKSEISHLLTKSIDDILSDCENIGLGIMFYDSVTINEMAMGIKSTIYRNVDYFYFKK